MYSFFQKPFFLFALLFWGEMAHSQSSSLAKMAAVEYVCTPCGSECDNQVYDKAGTCPHCGMALIDKKSIGFKNVTPAQLCQIVSKHPKVVLLDVRTPEEFNGKAEVNFGRLKNAINIPVQELENRMAELEKYKNQEIIVYCSHSHRSPRASYLLTTKGFTNVKNMSGGMSVWEDSVKNEPNGKDLLVK